jgi:hypothetical protein
MTLSVTMPCYYAECPNAEFRILFTIMLNVIMLIAFMVCVIILSVVAPANATQIKRSCIIFLCSWHFMKSQTAASNRGTYNYYILVSAIRGHNYYIF